MKLNLLTWSYVCIFIQLSSVIWIKIGESLSLRFSIFWLQQNYFYFPVKYFSTFVYQHASWKKAPHLLYRPRRALLNECKLELSYEIKRKHAKDKSYASVKVHVAGKYRKYGTRGGLFFFFEPYETTVPILFLCFSASDLRTVQFVTVF